MARRVLITGGAGFIGSHLVRRCLDRGDEVHVVVRAGTSSWRLDDVMPDVAIHRLDLADDGALGHCLAQARPHQVFHLAAEMRNRSGTDVRAMLGAASAELRTLAALLKGLAGLRAPPEAFVRAGSIAEYGTIAIPFREGQAEAPANAYAAALLAGTHFMQALRPYLPFAAVTARLALIYGPDQSEDFLIPRLIGDCIAGRRSRIARPDDRRDLLFVDDAVAALLGIAAAAPGDGIINVATGTAPSMREVAGIVARATGADPALLEFAEADGGPVSALLAAPDLARRTIGWAARTRFADGIAQTVARVRRLEPLTV